jgi:oligopeptide transport system ATP-binding protein
LIDKNLPLNEEGRLIIMALLQVKNLFQHFKISRNFTVKAVNGVTFEINAGETYGLVGESGSGKTTIGRSIIRLYDPTGGEIIFNGKKISDKLDAKTNKMLRQNMQMIFQDPMSSLNPRKKIGDIIAEGLDIHKLYNNLNERKEIIGNILKKVGLSPAHAERYPQQFSGGQRQRVGIARALVMNPKLIIADECISALDVSIQAQVVNLMKDIQAETNCAYLFIAHDLSMVKYISDRIGVLHKGYLVETGTTQEIFSNPLHPYTQSLLSAVPQPNPKVEKNRQLINYNSENVNYDVAQIRQVTDTHFVLEN